MDSQTGGLIPPISAKTGDTLTLIFAVDEKVWHISAVI